MTQYPQFNAYKPIRKIATPTCQSCQGSTIGSYGEQCMTCEGRGFIDVTKRPDRAADERRYEMRARR